MSIKLELNGIVFQKDEPKTNNSYKKQELILLIPDIEKDKYSDYFNIEWNEKEIEDTLKNEYGWISDKSYGKNQWRMGDAQTSFNNFIYYHMAGFSEFDNFRSNQIREDLIDRKEALRLCEEDNKIKFDTLKNFSEVIGFNLDNVLSKISSLDKLY